MADEDQSPPPFFTASDDDIDIHRGSNDDEALTYSPVATGTLEHRRGRRRLAMVSVALVAALVITLVVIGAGGPGSGDASAQVILGARTTLAKNSLALTYSGSITVGGQAIAVTGTGMADLATRVEASTLSFNVQGHSVVETLLGNDDSSYMQMTENGKNLVSELLPGKQWVQLISTASSGAQSDSQNVQTQLQLLTQRGNKVVPLGPSTINGRAVTGYQVTMTAKAIRAAEKRLAAENGAPTGLEKEMFSGFERQPPVVKIWIDANHLVTREEVLISFSTVGAAVGGDVIVDFSKYGGPVSISIPAAGVVGSYSAFEAAAKAAS
jgi:hypothetical protein